MGASKSYAAYLDALRANFWRYRQLRFSGQDQLFRDGSEGDAVVFQKNYAHKNILIPPTADVRGVTEIVQLIPNSSRHPYFGSMRSSQALAQSIFGALKISGQLSMLSSILADDHQPAFSAANGNLSLQLEKSINTLGERTPRNTSVDVWWSADGYQVAVECKFGERLFGKCSRPGRKESDPEYCNGDYAQQKNELIRFCVLTEIGPEYWRYLGELCGTDWDENQNHRPCPLNSTYQLVRNVLAACVGDDRALHPARGHALIIYDERNPSMSVGGKCHDQWTQLSGVLKQPNILRRMSWQSFIRQWPRNDILDWLKDEIAEKYGLLPST